jgi:AcrR family transcriptional regulator
MPALALPAAPSYDERQEHLLRAAARVFAERGYHATTMRDLARASGMSLAGMYYYVRSKDALLRLVQERCFDRVTAGARDALAGVSDPVERLRAFVRHHVLFFVRHMAEMKVLSHEAESLPTAAGRALRAKKKAYSRELVALVAAAAPHRDPDACAVTAYALFGMMNWIYTWYRPGGPLPPEALAACLADLAVRAARAGVPAREEIG